MLGFNLCHDILNGNHVLIGGCTGSGKSVLLTDILWTLTGYNPTDDRMILIDPKKVELIDFKEFPHCIKYCDEMSDIVPLLDSLINLMNSRYTYMKIHKQKKSKDFRVYVIIDEFAQLISDPEQGKQIQLKLTKLLQLARAASIYFIIATQNPSKKNIPACIQQNIDYRVGLHCLSSIESRQVIGIPGCEKLPKFGRAIIKKTCDIIPVNIPMLPYYEIENRLLEYQLIRDHKPKRKTRKLLKAVV